MDVKSYTPNKYSEPHFSENIDIIKKLEAENNNETSCKVIAGRIEFKNNRISCESRKRKKIKTYFNLCLKHIRLKIIENDTIMLDNKSLRRIISDPFGNEIIVQFTDIDHIELVNQIIERFNNQLKQRYRNIEVDVCFYEECNTRPDNYELKVCGTTVGSEMKKIAEEHFKRHGQLSTKLSLEIQHNRFMVPVIDDMSILYLYEYICNFQQPLNCEDNCKTDEVIPKLPITLIIMDPINTRRKHFYSKTKTCTKYGKFGKIKLQYDIDAKLSFTCLPTWLKKIFSDIYYVGSRTKGIFRSCPPNEPDGLYEFMLTRDDFIIEDSIDSKASILKFFIKKIKGGLLNMSKKDFSALIDGVETTQGFIDNRYKMEQLSKIFNSLSPPRLSFLHCLLIVLKSVYDNYDITEMNVSSIATILAQSIFDVFIHENMNKSKLLRINTVTESILLSLDTIADADRNAIIMDILLSNRQECDSKLENQSDGVSLKNTNEIKENLSTRDTELSIDSDFMTSTPNNSPIVCCANGNGGKKAHLQKFGFNIISPIKEMLHCEAILNSTEKDRDYHLLKSEEIDQSNTTMLVDKPVNYHDGITNCDLQNKGVVEHLSVENDGNNYKEETEIQQSLHREERSSVDRIDNNVCVSTTHDTEKIDDKIIERRTVPTLIGKYEKRSDCTPTNSLPSNFSVPVDSMSIVPLRVVKRCSNDALNNNILPKKPLLECAPKKAVISHSNEVRQSDVEVIESKQRNINRTLSQYVRNQVALLENRIRSEKK